jgi:hypothetical protein
MRRRTPVENLQSFQIMAGLPASVLLRIIARIRTGVSWFCLLTEALAFIVPDFRFHQAGQVGQSVGRTRHYREHSI